MDGVGGKTKSIRLLFIETTRTFFSTAIFVFIQVIEPVTQEHQSIVKDDILLESPNGWGVSLLTGE